jgi:hypothetical protein
MIYSPTSKNCLVCEKEFFPRERMTHERWRTNKYCSLDCCNLTRKGVTLSVEHRQTISDGLTGREVTQETRKKIAISNTGKKRTPEQLATLSKAHIGIPNQHKGEKLPERSGSNHWNWKEDRTSLIVSEKKHLDGKYREWMKAVKDRDSWKCKMGNEDCSGRVVAHHILRWSLFPELRYEVNNGITLCAFHHPLKINDEKALAPTFKELIAQ